jgi:hypothetical protein
VLTVEGQIAMFLAVVTPGMRLIGPLKSVFSIVGRLFTATSTPCFRRLFACTKRWCFYLCQPLFEAAGAQEDTDEKIEKLREEIASAMWADFVQN